MGSGFQCVQIHAREHVTESRSCSAVYVTLRVSIDWRRKLSAPKIHVNIYLRNKLFGLSKFCHLTVYFPFNLIRTIELGLELGIIRVRIIILLKINKRRIIDSYELFCYFYHNFTYFTFDKFEITSTCICVHVLECTCIAHPRKRTNRFLWSLRGVSERLDQGSTLLKPVPRPAYFPSPRNFLTFQHKHEAVTLATERDVTARPPVRDVTRTSVCRAAGIENSMT